MNYIAIISVLVVIIMFLLYISTSNKGWNCTENGCAYVSGGAFSSYDKCNSYCKSSSKLNSFKENESENETENETSSCSQPAFFNPFPYAPMGYGYYHPSLYYHDNHWNRGGDREHHHHHHSGGGKTKNHNENNIVINSPTGPN